MLDWKGLLKWSITHSDGTVKKDIKPMDDETKKWLSEALAEHALQDVKRMQEILAEVHKEEKGTQEDEDYKVAVLEELEDIVDNLDMADSLYHIGGLVELIRQALNSKYPRVQQISLSIFITCNQNNPHVQQWSIIEGAFQFLNLILNCTNMKTKEWALAALSSLIRGENLQSKRDLIEIEGLEFLCDILKDTTGKYSEKMKNKALMMLKDLVFYDHRLNFTYNNLDSFSNTNAKVVNGKPSKLMKPNNSEKNNEVSYDQNKEMMEENEKPENLKYKDCVKTYLIKQNFLNTYFSYLDGLANNMVDQRINYLDIFNHIIEYSAEVRSQLKDEKLKIMKEKMLAVMKHNSQNDNVNEHEISLYKDILVNFEKK